MVFLFLSLLLFLCLHLSLSVSPPALSLWFSPCLSLKLVPFLFLFSCLFFHLSSSLPLSLHPSAVPQAFTLAPVVPRPVLCKFSEPDRGAKSTPSPSKAHNLMAEGREKHPEVGRRWGATPQGALPAPTWVAPPSPASSCFPVSREFLLPRVRMGS